MMLIGDNLKRLRQQKGLTQEQLSVVFGVSPQAVSRWENDTAYPDITMLPGLADFFCVTVDALLCIDRTRRAEELSRIHLQVQERMAYHEPQSAAEILRKGLKRFPDDNGLMIELCSVLTGIQTDAAMQEACLLGEQLLRKSDLSSKAKTTLAATLAYAYHALGEDTLAAEKIRMLPHVWESRELIAMELSGEKEQWRNTVTTVAALLYEKMQMITDGQKISVPAYLQLGFVPKQTDIEEMLKQIQKMMLILS